MLLDIWSRGLEKSRGKLKRLCLHCHWKYNGFINKGAMYFFSFSKMPDDRAFVVFCRLTASVYKM